MNVVRGAGIVEQLKNVNRALGLLNVAGDVAMFAPVGLLAPIALGWTRGRTTLACLLVSLLIEGVQTATGGIGDIDDVLLNTLGALQAQPSPRASPHGRPTQRRLPSGRLTRGVLAPADTHPRWTRGRGSARTRPPR